MRSPLAFALALAALLALALASRTRAGAGEPSQALAQRQLPLIDKLLAMTSPDAPDRPALLFRRAELCMDLAGPVASASDGAAAAVHRKWLAAAADTLVALAARPRFSAYARADETLFYLVYVLTELQRDEPARRYFEQLQAAYPASKFLPDAEVAFADRAFARGDLEAAARRYDAAVARGESRVRDYARYKLGWCALERGDSAAAVAQFASLAKSAAGRLRVEARRDLVRALARANDATHDRGAAARALFTDVDGEHVDELLDLLAAAYRDAGNVAGCRALARGVACD